jgi:4-amino-4-deoxy-L-arabinose transferase-like glycosyltransferase
VSSASRNIAVVVVAAAALYLVGNARVSLWDRDEPRYAQTSRQMLEGGDWVVPRFLDKVRTAKPVFIYWCQAAAMAVIGKDGDAGVFAARLPSAIAMTSVLVIAGVVVRRGAGAERAFWTVLVLASSVLVVWSAKACTTDAVLLVGITVAQLCLYAIWRGRATWPVVIVLAVAVAQAGLTKGPVVLGVMGATLAALGALRVFDVRRSVFGVRRSSGGSDANIEHRTPNAEHRTEEGIAATGVVARVVVALVVVAALVGPWLYLVQRREAAFLGASVSHDVLRRIAQPLEGHRGPPGYHLVMIFATSFPWSLLLPMAVVFAWRNRADPQVRFALAAVVGPWVMFELVRTKLPHYMLPAFPPLAFLTADAVVRCLRGEHDDLRRRPFVVTACVVATAMVGLSAGPVMLARQFGDPVLPAVMLAVAALVVALAVLNALLRGDPRRALLRTGMGMGVVYAVLFGVYLPSAGALRVSAATAEILRREGATGPGAAVMMDYKEGARSGRTRRWCCRTRCWTGRRGGG